MKFYSINNSDSGYCLKLSICSEKTPINSTVLNLMNNYLNHWHVLYVDNFYNSESLANLLYEKKTYIMGTLRYGRGGPKDLK